MSNEPGTAGKFAVKLAEREMEPLRKYFRQRRASVAGSRDRAGQQDQASQQHRPKR